MKLIFLGTGTSQGVPVIGCDCQVCLSRDPRDHRLRSSVMFIKEGFHLLIDISPDLRQQLLTHYVDKIDAVCITHEHHDHVGGLDDIRPVNFKWRKPIPLYTSKAVIHSLQHRFHYAFESAYAARPRLTVHEVDANESLRIGPFEVKTVRIDHGFMDILGFIVDDCAYLTDIKSIPENALPVIKACETVILSALHKLPHRSHQTLDEAISLARTIGASQTYLTHIAHGMGLYQDESEHLPANIAFAHDNLILEW